MAAVRFNQIPEITWQTPKQCCVFRARTARNSLRASIFPLERHALMRCLPTVSHVRRLLQRATAEIESSGEAEVALAGRTFRIEKQFLDDIASAPTSLNQQAASTPERRLTICCWRASAHALR